MATNQVNFTETAHWAPNLEIAVPIFVTKSSLFYLAPDCSEFRNVAPWSSNSFHLLDSALKQGLLKLLPRKVRVGLLDSIRSWVDSMQPPSGGQDPLSRAHAAAQGLIDFLNKYMNVPMAKELPGSYESRTANNNNSLVRSFEQPRATLNASGSPVSPFGENGIEYNARGPITYPNLSPVVSQEYIPDNSWKSNFQPSSPSIGKKDVKEHTLTLYHRRGEECSSFVLILDAGSSKQRLVRVKRAPPGVKPTFDNLPANEVNEIEIWIERSDSVLSILTHVQLLVGGISMNGPVPISLNDLSDEFDARINLLDQVKHTSTDHEKAKAVEQTFLILNMIKAHFLMSLSLDRISTFNKERKSICVKGIRHRSEIVTSEEIRSLLGDSVKPYQRIDKPIFGRVLTPSSIGNSDTDSELIVKGNGV